MSVTDSARIRTALAYALLQPCVVCDGPATVPGMFLPHAEHAHMFGERPDRRRIIFYALCEECFSSPSRERDTEAAIARGVGR